MKSVSPLGVAQLLERPDCSTYAVELLALEPGYYSAPELAHRIAGADKLNRTIFYQLIDAMQFAGFAPILCSHNGQTLRMFQIDHDQLREFFAGLQ